ncbi:MAG TPA: extracellular solute-binding protein [Chloroflexota bacterium]|nr:extracellular solute-binding protein [Chloroflexota bacterium]
MKMAEAASRRKVLGWLATAAAGVVGACAPRGTGTTDSGPAGTSSSRQPVTLLFESYSSGGGSGGSQGEFGNWEQALARAKEKYPHLSFEAAFIGGQTPGAYDRWTVAMTAGAAPHIMEFETKRMASFAELGMLLDLTAYAARSRLARKEDFLESDWEKTIYKGKQWLLVAMSKPAVFFYNTESLKKIGVDGLTTRWGDPAWTWDAFVQLCKQLTTGTGAGATYGFGQSTWWVYMQPFVWSAGGDFLNRDRTAGAVDQPEALEALQRLSDLNLKEKAMPTAANAPQGSPSFNNGRVAIQHNNSGNWIGYSQVPDLRFDVAPVPTGKKGTIARNPPNGWASWSGNKHPDDTWLVFEELTQPESLRNIEGIPARKAQAEQGDFNAAKHLQSTGGHWQVFIEAKKNSRDEPVTQYFQDLDKTISAAQEAFWRGELPVREWAQKLRTKIDAVQQGQGPQDW